MATIIRPDYSPYAFANGSAVSHIESSTDRPPAHDGSLNDGAREGLGAPKEHSIEPFSVPGASNVLIRSYNPVVSSKKKVHRDLGGLQLFMITINATVGVGLFWNSGTILNVGGPLVLVISYFVTGLVAWAVMQCVAELLCLWPMPGALSLYVREFLDPELASIVGISYWFTYSVSFAALISTLSSVLEFWTVKTPMDPKGFNIGVVYIVVPLIMVAINTLKVKIYGRLEVGFGAIKVVLFFIIVIALAVAQGKNKEPESHDIWRDATQHYNRAVSGGWGQSLLIGLQEASFAYVGIEIMAASALEVRPRRRHTATTAVPGGGRIAEAWQGQRLSRNFKLCAIWTPLAVWSAYSLASILVSLDVPQDACVLTPPSWADLEASKAGCQSYDKRAEATAGVKVPVSVFVHIVRRLGQMPHFVNACIAFSAFTCASTNLYVASRELFGITCHIEGGPSQSNPLLRLAAWFGVTNRHRVPVRAMGFSAIAFMWVPIFKQTETERAKTFTAILSSMGTVGVLVVWGAVCTAYIRYLACIRRHSQYLSDAPQVHRRARDYPYRSSPQPLLAYFAVFGTLFLLLIASSAPLWNQDEFNTEPFLSSYLVVFLFIGLWVILKCARRASWRPVDLSDAETVRDKLLSLHTRTLRWALDNDEANNVNEA